MIEPPSLQTSSIHSRVAASRDAIISFLRDIVAIPSHDSNIREVAARVERELRALGFSEIHYAPYGDIVAKIGDGPAQGGKILLYDSHLDTVDAGDVRAWQHAPYAAEIADGILFGRGACDEKGSTPPMIYGLKIAHELGLLDGITAYYFGSIEEWCEGLSARVFVEEEKIKPNFVVIGEPTNLRVYRGHKGRCEIRVTARGKSAHGASHWLGDNAIYKMQALLAQIPELDARLPNDPFLGRGSIVATMIDARGGSNNVVPDRCEIILDRRLTFGESADDALAQVRALVNDRGDFEIEIVKYAKPSYNGYRRVADEIFPAWAFKDAHPFVRAARETSRALNLETVTGKWNFSTNGAYWAGIAKIPSVGFGPGDENVAHIVDEWIRVDDVARAAEWYALLPKLLSANLK
ncbi:MAG: YgeY family selenium metabolism-linked hydrolase [Chloroflexi bacterium]|nr:YgeY family selenium metabolism-linked hydrolase [Chloroflexota bacterium]